MPLNTVNAAIPSKPVHGHFPTDSRAEFWPDHFRQKSGHYANNLAESSRR